MAVYGLPYLDPDAVREPWGAARPLPRGRADRGDAPGPRRPRRPAAGHPLGRAGPRLRRRAPSPATPSATSASAVSRWCRPRSSTASTTPRSGHLHGRHDADRDGPLQRLAAGLLVLRGRPRQGLLAGRPRRRRLRPRRLRRGPGPPPARPAPRRRSTTCSPTPAYAVDEDAWVQATLTDAVRPLQAMERLRAPVPAHPGARVRARRRPRPRPVPTAAVQRPQRPRRSPSTSSPRCAAPRPPSRGVRAAARRLRRLLRGPRASTSWSRRDGGLMRLHQLEITAFGPFADTVERRLRRALRRRALPAHRRHRRRQDQRPRRRLLRALRRRPRRPRHAPSGCAPTRPRPASRPGSSSSATLAGRRFRIARSPAWERPKKRGTGTTTEQASVVDRRARRRRRGSPLATRLDETGHLVTGLLGMNLAQFTQVAMLPQGRFQAFLRARSEERHQLLQQLFRTGRFEDVERWLRDRRLDAARATRRGPPARRRRPGQPAQRDRRRDRARGSGTARRLALAADHGEVAAWAEGLVPRLGPTRSGRRRSAHRPRGRRRGTRGRSERRAASPTGSGPARGGRGASTVACWLATGDDPRRRTRPTRRRPPGGRGRSRCTGPSRTPSGG